MANRSLGVRPSAAFVPLLALLATALLSPDAAGGAPSSRGGMSAAQDPAEPGTEPAEEPAAEAPAPIATVDAERGLARAEAERKPLLVIALPAAAAPAYRAALASDLRESTRTRLTEEFIVVEVALGAEGAWPASEPAGGSEVPAPWSAKRSRTFLEGRLGRLGDAPALALLDFSGVLLVRYDGEPPSDAKLKRALRAASGANQKRAKLFTEAEKMLEQLGLALKRKQHPEACRLYGTLRGLDLPLDSKPAIARGERWKELEAAYEARVAEAKKLEDDDDLAHAVAEYERVLQEFPLPDWQDENRRRIGILWRKIYGRTG